MIDQLFDQNNWDSRDLYYRYQTLYIYIYIESKVRRFILTLLQYNYKNSDLYWLVLKTKI